MLLVAFPVDLRLWGYWRKTVLTIDAVDAVEGIRMFLGQDPHFKIQAIPGTGNMASIVLADNAFDDVFYFRAKGFELFFDFTALGGGNPIAVQHDPDRQADHV